MCIRRFTTQRRLRQLHCIYDKLPESGQEILADAAESLRAGRRPPRVWVFVDDDGRPLRVETTSDET